MAPIDINADVGEGCRFDAALMPFITSANVCAGFHAGSPEILRQTIELAAAHGVRVGAHPGFADREYFGRRELPVTPAEAEALVARQIAIVAEAAGAQGVSVRHVKPHGALYNMAARDRALADAVVRAAAAHGSAPALALFAPPGSALFDAACAAGLSVVAEGFPDRAYTADGSLMPRSARGAVIDEVDAVVERAVRMARDGVIAAADGMLVPLAVGTLCIHGDTPGCDMLAARIRAALDRLAL